MHRDDGTFLGIYNEKNTLFLLSILHLPFFSLHLGDKQKRSPLCFRIGNSSSHASREHTGDTDDGQMHFGQAVVHLHELDDNSTKSTQEGWGGDSRGSEAFASLQWHTLSPITHCLSVGRAKNKKPGPIT